jgi:ABC-type branched-subunit amino acid transport system ATPase component
MLLELKELVSGYGNLEILHGVNMEVDLGEIVCIIGPNGAGKSTVLKTIFGLLKPDSGLIFFDGENIGGIDPHLVIKKGISFIPQDKNVFPSLTVEENLAMGAYTRPDMVSTGKELVFSRFPILRDKRDIQAGYLSGGERKMLAIGIALMLEPTILLMDEPSMGLSPKYKQAVFDKIADINEDGTSILIVEQNAYKALKISHRGYILDMGKNRFQGESTHLLENPQIKNLYLGG